MHKPSLKSCLHHSALLVLAMTMALAIGRLEAEAQDNNSPRFIAEGLNKNAVFWAWKGNADVQQCGHCHYQPGNEFASRTSDLSRFTELKEWLEKDKHAIARQRIEPIPVEQQVASRERFRAQAVADAQRQINIPDYWLGPSNALSAKICKQLGQDVSTEVGYQWFRESCLTCHGGYDVKHGFDRSSKPSETDFNARDVNHPGISCNYCHQEAKGSTQWIALHSGLLTDVQWNKLTPAQKTTAGMRSLTPIQEQAQLCLECHVGNMEKGMFVTHDMYAAGHPPLPAVELRTLIEEMPRHWETPREWAHNHSEPNDAARSHLKNNYGLNVDARAAKSLPWDAQAIAVGALVAEQRSLQLLIQADAADRWGDYALYDCTACHHELQLDSRRQKLRALGRPGRPRLTEWSHPGAIAVAASLGQSEFKTACDQLQVAVKRRAFGDRKAVSQACQTMLKQTSLLLEQLSIDRLPRDYNSKLLLRVCETSPESLLDYQTARWVNWSARGLVLTQDETKNQSNAAGQVQKLGQAIGIAGEDRVTVTRKLPATQSEIIFPDFVASELELQGTYDPDSFLLQLQEIRQALQSNPQPVQP